MKILDILVYLAAGACIAVLSMILAGAVINVW